MGCAAAAAPLVAKNALSLATSRADGGATTGNGRADDGVDAGRRCLVRAIQRRRAQVSRCSRRPRCSPRRMRTSTRGRTGRLWPPGACDARPRLSAEKTDPPARSAAASHRAGSAISSISAPAARSGASARGTPRPRWRPARRASAWSARRGAARRAACAQRDASAPPALRARRAHRASCDGADGVQRGRQRDRPSGGPVARCLLNPTSPAARPGRGSSRVCRSPAAQAAPAVTW